MLAVRLTGCTACEEQTAEPSSRSEAPAEAKPVSRAVPPLLELEEPRQFRFLLHSSSTLPGQSGHAEMTVAGGIWLSGRGEGRALSVAAVLEKPESKVNGEEQSEFQSLVMEMTRGAVFRFDSGVLKELSLPSSVQPQVANMWRTIGAALQHGGEGVQAGNWTAREHDSTGEYEASYRWKAERLIREKKKYFSVLQSGVETASRDQLLPQVKTSKAEIALAGERLSSLTLDETIDADLQKGVTMTVTTHLELERKQDASPTPELVATFGRLETPEQHASFPAEKPISLRSAGVDQSQFDHLRIKDWTFEAALAGAAGVEELGGENQEEKTEERRRVYSAYAALTAYLRSHPETHARAKKAIVGSEAPGRVAVSALGDAGTNEAQALLIETIRNESLPAELRSRAIVRLAMTDVPVPEAVDAISAQLQSERLWGQAVLSLGILGRQYRDTGRDDDFQRASRAIEAELQEFGDASGRKLGKVLAAVSNLGDKRLLPQVRPYLESADEDTRASAAFALRHMKDDSVDPLLVKALAENGKTKSRLKVLSAMRVRGPQPELRDALAQLLAHEQTQGQVLKRARRLYESWEGAIP